MGWSFGEEVAELALALGRRRRSKITKIGKRTKEREKEKERKRNIKRQNNK